MAPSTNILLQNGTVLSHSVNAGDKVTPLRNTDVLITGNVITRIGNGLEVPKDAQVIDCTGKIVSPGFINTHHHMWPTQLKGRHADQTLFNFIPVGNMTSHCYSPSDTFWGQLGGCLESIDAGTTCVLDHANGCYTEEHASECLRATSASGMRSIYAFAPPLRMARWTKDDCFPNPELIPEWSMAFIEEWASQEAIGDGRFQIGYAFDFFSLPKDIVVGAFERVRRAGVKRITCHIVGKLGFDDIVWSHCNELTADEKQILGSAGIYIACTPETEGHMGCGYPVALDAEFRTRASLGADIHSLNSASILSQARMLLQTVRSMDNQKLLDQGKYPQNLRGSSEEAFNLATIQGARALGMADQIGSIAEGKLADLVIFDAANSLSMACAAEYDPVVAVVRHSDTRDVDTVIVDGHVRKRNGKLVEVEVNVTGSTGENKPKRRLGWRAIAAELVVSQSAIQKRIDAISLEKGRELFLGTVGVDASQFVPVE